LHFPLKSGKGKRLADSRFGTRDPPLPTPDLPSLPAYTAARPSVTSGADRSLEPIRNRSIARAAPRPSLMAHTTSDCPRRQSPQAKTLGRLVANLPCWAL